MWLQGLHSWLQWEGSLAWCFQVGFRARRWSCNYLSLEVLWRQLWPGLFPWLWSWTWLPRNIHIFHCSSLKRRIHRDRWTISCSTWRWLLVRRGGSVEFTWDLLNSNLCKHRLPKSSRGRVWFCQIGQYFGWPWQIGMFRVRALVIRVPFLEHWPTVFLQPVVILFGVFQGVVVSYFMFGVIQ